MNVNDFNKMSNKEKFSFIDNNYIKLIEYSDVIDVMSLIYTEKTDSLELYSVYTDETYDVLDFTYEGNNYFKAKLENYSLNLNATIFVDAFDKEGNIKEII